MSNEKILDRVRKLLALSKDASSPNEAAIAARRARKLMDEYQISELELTTTSESDMGTTEYNTKAKQRVKAVDWLSVSVAKLNDCQVRLERHNGILVYKFEGMLVDTVCANEMFKYLRDTMYKYAEKNTEGRANRHAYRVGFADGVIAKIRDILKEREQLKISSGTGLMVIKKQLVEQEFGSVNYGTDMVTYSGEKSSYEQGYLQGRKTGFDRQVQGHTQQYLN